MIHPSAIVHESVKIGKGVKIGPWTQIGENVEIGDKCEISSHVVVKGPTIVGNSNKIYQFATVGDDTPDLKYKGEKTELVIGNNNTIREGVTIHRGTIEDKGITSIGDNNLFMVYCHVAHDCVISNNIVLAKHNDNYIALGLIKDRAFHPKKLLIS